MVRKDGRLLLTHDVDAGPGYGTVLGTDAPWSLAGLSDGAWLVGGVAPSAAVSVRVRTDAGPDAAAALAPGAWVAVLPEGPHPREVVVLLLDGSGAPVRRALPQSWTRAPITDTDERCPACDGAAWELVTAVGVEARGGWQDGDGRMHASPVAVCGACGHEEGAGGGVVYAYDDDEPLSPEDQARAARWLKAEGRRRQKVLARAPFPILCIAGPDAAALGGYGGGDRTTDRVTVRTTGGVDVESSGEAPWGDALWHALESAGSDDDWSWPQGVSDAALSLALAAHHRARRAEVATAVPAAVEVRRAGHDPVVAHGRASVSAWAIQAGWDDVHVLVSGPGPCPAVLSLDAVADRDALAADDAWG